MQTNTYEGEKAKFDTRIKKLSANILNNPSNRKDDTVILESATQAKQFNISTEAKKEKCIEYALSISFIKVSASFARTECTKIFNDILPDLEGRGIFSTNRTLTALDAS